MKTLLLLAPCLLTLSACTRAAQEAEPSAVTSLLGEALERPALDEATRTRLEADLAAARAEYEADPDSEMAAIWVGRRLGYLARYREAVAWFGAALERHPESFKLLRHRGHRRITLRDLDGALSDLTRAAELAEGTEDEVEPDGAPNELGIPRSTTRSNILYHLGLAQWLAGDFEAAAETYERCLEFAQVNDDMLVATLYWRALSLRRLGRDAELEEALLRVSEHMSVIENLDYWWLLLHFKGRLTEVEVRARSAERGSSDVASATVGYGLAAWRLLAGDREEAERRFQDVLLGGSWAAFGRIAAEAELLRLGASPPMDRGR